MGLWGWFWFAMLLLAGAGWLQEGRRRMRTRRTVEMLLDRETASIDEDDDWW
jgi:hypothetical protein